MLDGKAYKTHFPDDPAYDAAGPVEAPRIPNSAVLLAALAALDHESRTILIQTKTPMHWVWELGGVVPSLHRMRPKGQTRLFWLSTVPVTALLRGGAPSSRT